MELSAAIRSVPVNSVAASAVVSLSFIFSPSRSPFVVVELPGRPCSFA
jgi:hypothetical protein